MNGIWVCAIDIWNSTRRLYTMEHLTMPEHPVAEIRRNFKNPDGGRAYTQSQFAHRLKIPLASNMHRYTAMNATLTVAANTMKPMITRSAVSVWL